ncbi:hypothetical protein BR93DRAFT_930450 [Coniochaeta sp. PMI_546]|nr:hypothetical protein BR93DRAFT_930450 [Coniochaeta sp. PMI_546]
MQRGKATITTRKCLIAQAALQLATIWTGSVSQVWATKMIIAGRPQTCDNQNDGLVSSQLGELGYTPFFDLTDAIS